MLRLSEDIKISQFVKKWTYYLCARNHQYYSERYETIAVDGQRLYSTTRPRADPRQKRGMCPPKATSNFLQREYYIVVYYFTSLRTLP